MKRSVCILTAYNSALRPVAALTVPRMHAFAQAHGYEVCVIERDDWERPRGWIKAEAIRGALDSNFDFLFWIDIDAVIVRRDIDVRTVEVDCANLHMVWHGPDTSTVQFDFTPHFNTGVMLIRANDWSRDFFKRTWEVGQLPHGWSDQATIHHLLGYDNCLALGPDRPDEPNRSHVARLDIVWNSIPGFAIAPDPIINHYAGLHFGTRLRLVEVDARTAPLREAASPELRQAFSWQLASWRQYADAASHERDAAIGERDAAIGERDAALADERSRRAALDASTADLTQAFAAERRHREAMEAKNQALLSSTSWRVTAPLRNVVKTVRSFRRSAIRKRRKADRSASKAVSEPAESDLPPSPENPTAGAFFRDGFIGPIDLFTREQCELILKHYRRGVPPQPEWPKDLAVRDRFFYEAAKQPALISLLRPLLGEDIVLWGASIVERAPGQTHIWHTDIETSAPKGRFVTVWVGLENISQGSALQLISRSHRFGRPIQQEVYERGLRRGEATDEMVKAWAQEHDGLSDFVQPDMNDGQALLFDGRLWHGSQNAGDRPRAALLLQYAAAGTPIVIPDFNHLEWPFRFTSAEPRSVVITGNSKNRNVELPPSACPPGASPVCSQVHLGSGFEESPDGWITYHSFQGPTPLLAEMESHFSVLSPGCSPHPPHAHVQEELLIVLRGEAEILVGETSDPNGARIKRLHPGSFVYYPAYQYHTIRNTSASPVTYLMYKWQAALAEVRHPMQAKVFDISGVSPPSPSHPMSMPVLFEGPTAYLDKLHAHVTDLQVGAGYPAHIDEHDVAIVVFTGTVETLGKTLGPGGTIFYAAGEPHGMRNVGDERARYLVFEFHRSKAC
jgi:mannose-6-phosphate isomerase-like protein (cupin superfamily)